MHCPHCHNHTLAWNFRSLPNIAPKKILQELELKKEWLDGLVISGGEPTTVPGLPNLLLELKRLGLALKLDSNGQRPEIIQDLLQKEIIDLFAIDIKGPYEKYPQLTGGKVTVQQARNNMQRILDLAQKNPTKFYFRTTIVPELDDRDLEAIRSYLPQGFDLLVQPYLEPSPQQGKSVPVK